MAASVQDFTMHALNLLIEQIDQAVEHPRKVGMEVGKGCLPCEVEAREVVASSNLCSCAERGA